MHGAVERDPLNEREGHEAAALTLNKSESIGQGALATRINNC